MDGFGGGHLALSMSGAEANREDRLPDASLILGDKQSSPNDDWPFGDLKMFGYDAIIADCAWEFKPYSDKGLGKSPQKHYDCMADEEILALPIDHLLRDGGMLFLWATWPKLDFAFQCIRKWGLKYVTGGAWLKETKHGKEGFGGGYWLRSACDPFLIASCGPPDEKRARNLRNFVAAHTEHHSEKPDYQYEVCEQLYPRGFYAELFSRKSRPGWDAWGDETGKFDGAVG